MNDKRLKIGVLGAANIAERFILPALTILEDKFIILGIASTQIKRVKALSDKFCCKAFDDYDQILEMSGLDAVYIPLPNSLHAKWIDRALNKGLHVLVEKSLSCEYAEAVNLNNKARELNLVLLENFQFKFHNQLKKIQQLIAGDAIGELRCLRSSFGFPPFPDNSNIRYQKHLGGGALLDAGAYTLKISQIFLGQNIKVKAGNLHINNDLGVDTWGGGYLAQSDGDLFAEVAFGFDNHYQCALELWGSKGKLMCNRIFTSPPGYSPILEIETPAGKDIIEVPADNHFIKMLTYFHGMIVGDISRKHEYSENINQARLIDELKVKANE